jgi:hypothetical protein
LQRKLRFLQTQKRPLPARATRSAFKFNSLIADLKLFYSLKKKKRKIETW